MKNIVSLLFIFAFPVCARAFELNGIGAADIPELTKTAEVPYLIKAVPAGQPSRLIVEPDDGRDALLNAINSARTTITLTMYQISDAPLVYALRDAQARGVKVRLQYNFYSFQNYSFNPNDWAVKQLTAAGAEARPGLQGFQVTHEKALVIDGNTAVIMGFNFGKTYFSGTRDFGYITSDPALVGEISRIFEADWTGVPAAPAAPALAWSPDNARSKMTALMDGAHETLDVYNELALDPGILATMGAAAKRGVKVRFINAASESHNGGGDPNQPGRDQLAAAGVQVKVITAPFIHAKAILADYGASAARAYIGSGNFSETSLDKDRELGVISAETPILASLENVFNQDWSR